MQGLEQNSYHVGASATSMFFAFFATKTSYQPRFSGRASFLYMAKK
jgi:hypothetical protein